MTRQWLRAAAVVAGLAALGGCGGLSQGSIFDSTFWRSGPLDSDNQLAELGLADLAKGDFGRAEQRFQAALKRNPKDVYALIGSGVLYQSTGQPTRARAMYEAVLAIRPGPEAKMVVLSDLDPRPVSEVASVNLALLDTGEVSERLRGAAPESGARDGMGGTGTGGAMGGAPSPQSPFMGAREGGGGAEIGAAEAGLDRADENTIARFETLRLLLDRGLVTPDEYRTRRSANLGALLPLTAPPPAAGLGRPIPEPEQIAARLRALGRALEMRAISTEQHAEERTMILDALLPAAPVRVAQPAPPPDGLMEAADMVRRLERLRAGGLITSDEFAQERAAIERALQSGGAAAPAGGAQPPAAQGAGAGEGAGPRELRPAASAAGPQPGLHLASYRSERNAQRGWSQLRRAYGGTLSGLQPYVERVDLGPGKGIFYRLKAGPVDSQARAADLCRQLKRRGQFCQPTFVDKG